MMLENAANLKTTSVKQAIFLLLAVLVQRYKQGYILSISFNDIIS